MTLSVIKVAVNGLPVSQAPAGYGYPCVLSTNGFGLAITPVATGGRPIADATIGGGIFSGIQLSNSTFVVGSATSSVIGTLSVVGGATTTWSPSDKTASITLSNGNLTATVSTSASSSCRGTSGLSSGKYYWEFTIVNIATNSYGVGVATSSVALGSGVNVAGTSGVTMLGNGWVNGTVQGGTLGTRANGNILSVAVDLSAKLIWFRVAPSGNWNGSGTADPATGTGGYSFSALTLPLYPFMGWSALATGQVITANFGASAFNGAVPSGFTAGWSTNPTYTFTLTDSASNKVKVASGDGSSLQVGTTVATVGSFPITVHADNGAGSTFDQTFLITVLPIAPTNSGGANLPTISGTPAFGNTLTASTGTWAGNPTPTYTYQWKRAGADISGATVSTYLLGLFDIGSTITVTVTATNSGGSASATSAATTTVTGLAPANSGGANAPVLSGTAADGQILSVTDGTWTGAPAPTFAYQWKRGGVTNIGTNSPNYTIVTADVGSTIRCDVTGTNAFGNATAQSNSSATVTSGGPPPTGTPTYYFLGF